MRFATLLPGLVLAACTAEGTAATPAGQAAAGLRSEARTFRDWKAVCDNGNACFAFGPASAGVGWVRVAIDAGPDARPGVMAGYWTGDQDGSGPMTLVIDGVRFTTQPVPDADAPHGRVRDEDALRVITAMAQGRTMSLSTSTRETAEAAESVSISLSGAAAALLWIDERQGRLDSTTALIRRGVRPAASVPAPPPLPRFTPAPSISAGDALLVLSAATFPLVAEVLGQQRQRLLRVAVVQPYIPQNEKWDEVRARDILDTLEQLTLKANSTGVPDLIVWPEAVTPWALHLDPNVQPWLESLARRTGKPLLLGVVAGEGAASGEEVWRNLAVVVDPLAGLREPGYAKRHLVPFGEYIPLRPLLGWLEKVVPIGGDFQPGESAAPLAVPAGREEAQAGVLICFEDIFPGLARDSVLAGADFLAVLTNNGWFGEGGAAQQHAAHSVLRAVETRRPVLRCGNGGWSGWIDEYGQIRHAVKDEAGSIYFRGFQTFNVTRDQRWAGRASAYTRHGDWFLAVCAGLAVLAFWTVRTLRVPVRREGESAY